MMDDTTDYVTEAWEKLRMAVLRMQQEPSAANQRAIVRAERAFVASCNPDAEGAEREDNAA